MKHERWVPVKDFPNYQISDLGNLRRVGKAKLMKSSGLRGYRQIRLSHEGKAKTVLVHRLVAEAFLPNPEGLPMVNHLDSNKANNAHTNLEWCTQLGNMRHAASSGRLAGASLAQDDVLAIRERVRCGHEIWQVARDFGLSESLTRSIATGASRRWVK